MRRFLSLATLAALCACADSEPPEAVPTDDGGAYNVVDPVKAPITDDAEPAIGQWIQSMLDEQPVLQFGPANTEPLFSIGCDSRGGILLNRHGTVVGEEGEMMSVEIGTATRNLAVNAAEGPIPKLRASVPVQDELLPALVAAKQPIRISMGDGQPLVLPASTAVGDFIRQCEQPGTRRAAAAASPAENAIAAEPEAGNSAR